MTDVAIRDLPNRYVELDELQDEYLICRTVGHSWDDNISGQVDGALARSAAAVLALRCVRCNTERFDYVDIDMLVFARYYRYPPRYRLARGQGKKPSLRGELLRRSVLIRRAGNRRRTRKVNE